VNNNTPHSNQELDSSNLLITIYRWRKTILISLLLAAVISALASFLITPKYKSTVTMFPAEDNSIGEHLMAGPITSLINYGEEEDGEYLMQLLESSEIRNKITDKFDLWSSYGIQKGAPQSKGYMNLAYSEHVNVEATKFGSVNVTVLDKDPEKAAAIANEISELADSLNTQMRRARATKALEGARKTSVTLQDEIKLIQDSIKVLASKGVFSFEEQILGMAKSYGKALASGKNESASKIKAEMASISEFGADYLALLVRLELAATREAHLNKRMNVFQAELDSELPVKMVVDVAEPSDKKAYPIRWLIVAVSIISTLIFVIAFVLIWESFSKLKKSGLI
jgi:uncharacterized protein involved in exopolysaccharide biosynthesis